MSVKIALAGNPNSGKTTLFNALTGSNQFVGNWPGVTVEKKTGRIRKSIDGDGAELVDLPGIYSLSPYTLEEVVARDYILDNKPDAVIDIIDGSNLERNLYLTTQLLELGIPVVIAVNMMDVVKKNGDRLDTAALSKKLGCEIAEISALKGEGTDILAEKAVKAAKAGRYELPEHSFGGSVEHALAHIEEAVLHDMPEKQQRFYAIKLFERDEKIRKKLGLDEKTIAHIEEDIEKCEKELDDDSESIITNERYIYVASVVGDCYVKKNKGRLSTTDKIDRVLTNRWLALPIFAAVMFLVYYISITTVGAWVTGWTNDTLFGSIVPGGVGAFLDAVNCAPWLSSLILDGMIGGVGAVLGFVPQMFVLFAFLAFLEACGYMARVAFIMDRIFRRFGLSGKSFIPILIGTGCGVPGVMASRTIENERDRRMTVMTTTFIPCGAKIPVIALIAGAIFNGEWWVAPSAYFLGITAIIVSGIILKKTKMFAGEPAPFVMELPAYHWPTAANVLRSMWERGWSFIKKAGTVILLATVFIWFVSSYGIVDGRIAMVDDMSDGFLADIGMVLAWLFVPLGFGDWKSAVATFTGLVAKENVVGTFGILYGYGSVADNGSQIWTSLAAAWTPAAAYSFLVFNLLCAPCFAAIGAIRREMNSGKWTWFAIGYQTVFAYCSALMIYNLSRFVAGGIFNAWTAAAIVIAAIMVCLLVRPERKYGNGRLSAETAEAGR